MKLANLIINTNHIIMVEKRTNKYHIHITGSRFGGFYWGLGGGFGLGGVSSHTNEIEVCETKHPTSDYKIVSDWIEKINNDI
jgi:hypothetical protein